jgi:SAM-dependent methyltransferase
VKNVKGHELPFNDNEGKIKWYDNNLSPPMPIQKKEEAVLLPGKDTTFWDVLIPFCHEHNVHYVLDVGAAYGRYTAWFADEGMHVEALEISPKSGVALRNSLNEAGYTNVHSLVADVETINFTKYYDLIFMSDVVEHLIDWEATMNKIADGCEFCYVLIPGGRSWDWTGDHLTIFGDEETQRLEDIFGTVMYADKVYYDKDNYWYTAILKGHV